MMGMVWGTPQYSLRSPAQNPHVLEHSQTPQPLLINSRAVECAAELKLRSPGTPLGGLPAAPSPSLGVDMGQSGIFVGVGFERVWIKRVMIKGLGEVSVIWTGFNGASPLSSGLLRCPLPSAGQ